MATAMSPWKTRTRGIGRYLYKLQCGHGDVAVEDEDILIPAGLRARFNVATAMSPWKTSPL